MDKRIDQVKPGDVVDGLQVAAVTRVGSKRHPNEWRAVTLTFVNGETFTRNRGWLVSVRTSA